MKIYKFGGGVINSADGIKNLHKIVEKESENLVIVVSAIGKTTNALERIAESFFNKNSSLTDNLQLVREYHMPIMTELFGCESDKNLAAYTALNSVLQELADITAQKPSLCYDFEYDRIVAFGELISSTIVSEYLNFVGLKNEWIDVRNAIITDNNYRDANVNMETSEEFCVQAFSGKSLTVTQGFIAGTRTNQTTTLGREGSDYSGAILANLLDAESLTIWKDVPGVMNADPRIYDDVQVIPKLSYKEAIELSYCGASVIHPKTIKPLKQKEIPLYVKPFFALTEPGSVINEIEEKIIYPPIYINKRNQVLFTLTPRDFSFIAEERLSKIFGLLANHKLKLSLVQMSAVSFTLCVDYDSVNFAQLLAEFQDEYEVYYNTDVELVTIRHYTQEIIDKLIGNRQVYTEQRNRRTLRFVVSR
ncbi:MAG: aspartate kinase [bacterium]